MTDENPTITIIGAGAIGCFVWGHWLNSIPNLRLLGRRSTDDRLQADGLQLSGVGDLQIAPQSIETDARCLEDSDLILWAIKSTGLHQAIEDIRLHANSGTPIICLLNGLSPVRDLKTALPDHQIVAGMVPFNVIWETDNKLHRSSAGNIALKKTEASQRLAKLVEKTGVPVELHEDLKPIQYGKLLLNLMNPINTLSGLPLREQLSQRGYREIYVAVVEEAFKVYEAAGVAYVKAGPFPPKIANFLLKFPDTVFNSTILKIQKIDEKSRTSMAFDYQAKKPTEIETINGEIVHLAEQAGASAPINAALVELIKNAEANAWATYSGEELKSKLDI